MWLNRRNGPRPPPSPEVASHEANVKSILCAFSKGRGDLPNLGFWGLVPNLPSKFWGVVASIVVIQPFWDGAH